ncbi:MAG TPA: hypothetical protein PLF46_01230 [Rectinema sp.]|jgi:hypothetical protein|nr:hypothetical protein [Rectinema sp.]HQO45774.1 hypothetical protein [Rectinema sp.]HQQ72291.1 hypothetical protein [Rectinema sp.]
MSGFFTIHNSRFFNEYAERIQHFEVSMRFKDFQDFEDAQYFEFIEANKAPIISSLTIL